MMKAIPLVTSNRAPKRLKTYRRAHEVYTFIAHRYEPSSYTVYNAYNKLENVMFDNWPGALTVL